MASKASEPVRRGDVWLVDLDPVRGHEQAGFRPALVLSVDAFNASPAELVTVLPITSKLRQVRSRVELRPPEGGLKVASHVIAEQPRTISKARFRRRVGGVSASTLAKVGAIVRVLLGL
jgi:mRNA interferase MazF